MYNNRRSNSQNYDRRDNHRHERHDYSASDSTKKISKSMILLKSTVFALFIVLVFAVAAFMIVRNNKQSQNVASSKCSEIAKINIPQAIESVKENDGVILVLTKITDGKQELVRIDSVCGRELSRIKFFVN